MVGEGSKVFRNDAGWPPFAAGTVFPPFAPGVKSVGLPLIIGTRENSMFVKSASLLGAAESQDSDGGKEGGGPGATSVQLLGRTLMELTSNLLSVKQQLCI